MEVDATRTCYRCGEVKPINKFKKNNSKRSGRDYLCQKCDTKRRNFKRRMTEEGRLRDNARRRRSGKVNVELLSDVYIKSLLRHSGIHHPAPIIIQLKRQQIISYRLLKDVKRRIKIASRKRLGKV